MKCSRRRPDVVFLSDFAGKPCRAELEIRGRKETITGTLIYLDEEIMQVRPDSWTDNDFPGLVLNLSPGTLVELDGVPVIKMGEDEELA